MYIRPGMLISCNVYRDDMLLVYTSQDMQPPDVLAVQPNGGLPAQMMIPVNRPIQQEHDCLICGHGPDGVRLLSRKGQAITNCADHVVTNAKHQRRLQQQCHLLPHVAELASYPGTIWFIRPLRFKAVYRCAVCSLDEDGKPRREHADMDPQSVDTHVGSAPHQRRCLDGRYALWDPTDEHM